MLLQPLVQVHRHDPFQERAAPGPGSAFERSQRVDLAHRQRWESTRKAGRGASSEGQLQRVGKILAAGSRRARAKGNLHSMFALLHERRAVQMQRLEEPAEVGRRHQQVDRMAWRKERRPDLARGHGLQRIEDQLGKADAGKRRFEPTPANEMGHLAPHLGACFRRNAFRHRIAGPAQQPPGKGLGPELGEAPPRPGIRVEQRIDVGILQPEVGQGVEAVPGVDRLGEKDGVYPSRTGAGEDVWQDAQAHAGLGLDRREQVVVDSLHP